MDLLYIIFAGLSVVALLCFFTLCERVKAIFVLLSNMEKDLEKVQKDLEYVRDLKQFKFEKEEYYNTVKKRQLEHVP